MPRLDRYLGRQLGIGQREVRRLLIMRRVAVDGCTTADAAQNITAFSQVRIDDRWLQRRTAHYLMMNKPPGVVSATVDAEHTTVIDLLDHPAKAELHLAGRLDFNSTGLLLLTNDGAWSKRLSLPESHIEKRYRVTVEQPLTEDYVTAFEQGMYFAYEGITTKPAGLEILGEYEAEVTLVEGRYHQVKRMFGRFRNKVLRLHRVAVGPIVLDRALAPGQSRDLATAELERLAVALSG